MLKHSLLTMDNTCIECLELQLSEMEALSVIYGDNDNVSTSSFKFKHTISTSGRISGSLSIYLDNAECRQLLKKDGTPSWMRNMRFLPPITMEFELPQKYPLEEAPKTDISCCWLSLECAESIISSVFGNVWEIGQGMSVLNSYVEAVRYNLAALPWVSIDIQKAELFKDYITKHNKTKLKEQFQAQTYMCMVCMEAQSGFHCIQLECSHVHCKQCLGGYLGLLIKEGNLTLIGCPHLDCRQTPEMQKHITHDEMSQVLTQTQIDRFDRLSILRRVDANSTQHAWCPREGCGRAVERDKTTEKLCVCKCGYAFCIFCRRVWHGINSCAVENIKEVAKHYHKALEESKRDGYPCQQQKHLEMLYGVSVLTKILRKYEEEKQSLEYIRGSTQACPSCKQAIAKAFGCNHMICTMCGTHFCYLCGDAINPDDPMLHFNSQLSPCFQRLLDNIESSDLSNGRHQENDQDMHDREEAEANMMIQLTLGT
ncbi:hypothetical protein BX070DRAFT_14158 [Coemansia spiralis]|nr:hypothetical protein BX070DRAFT_14158 [Coemansia spiralis]